MKVDAMTGPFANAAGRSAAAELLGADGVASQEVNHDPFLPLAAAAQATERVELITSIAIALARNPMTVALTARDLHDASNGRMTLGLGSQIKAHITRRYSMPWSAPAPRMREFIDALHAIWNSWREGSKLEFEGEFYRHTLMPPIMVPEPTPFANPRVALAAVNAGMARVAGEVADGLVCHGFSTPAWIKTALLPALTDGLATSGRDRSEIEISCPVLTATGPTEQAVSEAIEVVRAIIAFYGSTPAYRPVLALHGWEDLGVELHQCTVDGRWDQIKDLVPDEVVEAFAVVATWDELPNELAIRYGGVVDRVMYAVPFDTAPPDVVADMVHRLHKIDTPYKPVATEGFR